MQARVGGRGSDEIGRLASAFDEMAEWLEQAFHRERALEASRRELISAVSHDLRTPLTSILGSALTLEQTELKEALGESIARLPERASA